MINNKNKILSIFVDESGDLGEFGKHSPFYLLTLVFHNQENDISGSIKTLDSELEYLNNTKHYVHTAPLIRKEEDYVNLQPKERRTILTKLLYFAHKVNIKFKSLLFSKSKYNNALKLEADMTRELNKLFISQIEYFHSFDRIIVYYDFVQKDITKILNATMALNFTNYEFRKISPNDYKLFQVADLICTLNLINEKIKTKDFTRSEYYIFNSKSDFKKDFIKKLWKKEIK